MAGAKYSLVRTMARLRFMAQRTRLLWADRIPDPGRTLLVVNAPPRPGLALLMIAAFEKPLCWILPGAPLKGFSGWLLRRGCGARTVQLSSVADPRILAECERSLLGGRVLALFAGSVKDGQPADNLVTAAGLAIELARLSQDPSDPVVHWADVYAGSGPAGSLIQVAGPVYPREFLHRAGGDAPAAARSLALALEQIRGSNPFRLFAPELAFLLRDLEEILHLDLSDDWSRMPGWRQDAKEFELSKLVSSWTGRTNLADPARVVELRRRIEIFRESRRLWAAKKFMAETAGAWLASHVRRTLVWIEILLGFPVALYGAANHLAAGAVFAFLRRLEQRPVSRRAAGRAAKWIAAGIGVLCGYTTQILLCNHWFGRAAAGYYALTLPASGAYLWRYVWLLRHRAPGAVARLLSPFAGRRMLRARRAVVAELDQRVSEFAAGPQ